MSRPKHAGSAEGSPHGRRTNAAITATSVIVALWLGLTAPRVSPVTPVPTGVAAAAPGPLAP